MVQPYYFFWRTLEKACNPANCLVYWLSKTACRAGNGSHAQQTGRAGLVRGPRQRMPGRQHKGNGTALTTSAYLYRNPAARGSAIKTEPFHWRKIKLPRNLLPRTCLTLQVRENSLALPVGKFAVCWPAVNCAASA